MGPDDHRERKERRSVEKRGLIGNPSQSDTDPGVGLVVIPRGEKTDGSLMCFPHIPLDSLDYRTKIG